jgi:hypothetical protein
MGKSAFFPPDIASNNRVGMKLSIPAHPDENVGNNLFWRIAKPRVKNIKIPRQAKEFACNQQSMW